MARSARRASARQPEYAPQQASGPAVDDAAQDEVLAAQDLGGNAWANSLTDQAQAEEPALLDQVEVDSSGPAAAGPYAWAEPDGDDGGAGPVEAPAPTAADPVPPPPPAAPAPPPDVPAQAVEPLAGESVGDVAEQYAARPPTAMAASYGEVDTALGSAMDTMHAQLDADMPDALFAVMSDEAAVVPAGDAAYVPAPPPAMAMDTAPPQTDVGEAPVVEHLGVDSGEITGVLDGLDDAASQQAVSSAVTAALSAAPSANPGVAPGPGPTPSVPLEGESDPAQLDVAAAGGSHEMGGGLEQARQAVSEGPGPEVVRLRAMDEEISLQTPPAPEVTEIDDVAEMVRYVEWDLPAAATAQFDINEQPAMQASVQEANAEVAAAQEEWDTGRADVMVDAQGQVDEANAQAQSQQEDAVNQGRQDITDEQAATMTEQQAALDGAMSEMDAERGRAMGDIDARVAADQATIDGEFAAAQAESDRLTAQGEADAQQMQGDAAKEAEDPSWWEQGVSAITDAISAAVDAVCAMWDAIAEAVNAVIEAAVALAQTLIDAAVAFIGSVLSAYYDVVRLLVENLLAEAFPALAEALLAAIDAVEGLVLAALEAAGEWLEGLVLAALEAAGEWLKGAVATIGDWAQSAMNGLAAMMQAGVSLYGDLLTAVVTGDWEALADMAIRAVLMACGIPVDEFYETMGKAVEAWDEILPNPGALITNSVDAMVLGFEQFGGNFVQHFAAGAIEWITGAAGVQLPTELSIAGVFDVVCQVLGLSYDTFRDKAVEHVGEDAVAAVEAVVEGVMAFVEGGWAGLWEYVQDGLMSLWDDVIGAITTWLIEKAILVGARWIASAFSGVGLILEALIAAWQFMMWVIDQMAAMWGIVDAMVESVHDFVFGNIGPAADQIEQALAGMVPVAIDLVAKLLNISNIANKVQDIIEGVRGAIDQALDAVIETVLGSLGIKSNKEDEEGEFDGEIGEEIEFDAAGEDHRLWIEDGEPMVASTPLAVDERLDLWRKRLTAEGEPGKGGDGPPTDVARAQGELDAAGPLYVELKALLLDAVEVDEDVADDSVAEADRRIEELERTIANHIAQLFALFGDEAPDSSLGEPRPFTGPDDGAHVLAVADGGVLTIDGEPSDPTAAAARVSVRNADGDTIRAVDAAIAAFEAAGHEVSDVVRFMALGETATADLDAPVQRALAAATAFVAHPVVVDWGDPVPAVTVHEETHLLAANGDGVTVSEEAAADVLRRAEALVPAGHPGDPTMRHAIALFRQESDGLADIARRMAAGGEEAPDLIALGAAKETAAEAAGHVMSIADCPTVAEPESPEGEEASVDGVTTEGEVSEGAPDEAEAAEDGAADSEIPPPEHLVTLTAPVGEGGTEEDVELFLDYVARHLMLRFAKRTADWAKIKIEEFHPFLALAPLASVKSAIDEVDVEMVRWLAAEGATDSSSIRNSAKQNIKKIERQQITPILRTAEYLDFPYPDFGTHDAMKAVADVEKSPDGLTRESHHVPGKELAWQMGEQLQSVGRWVADKIEGDDMEFLRPLAAALQERGNGIWQYYGVTKGGKKKDGDPLSAILVHADTHNNAPPAAQDTCIHSTAIYDAFMAELTRIEEATGAELIRIAGDRGVVVNPKAGAWQAQLDEAWQRTVGANPSQSADWDRWFTDLLARLEASEDAEAPGLERTVLESVTSAYQCSFDNAVQVDGGRVRVALRGSVVDGEDAARRLATVDSVMADAPAAWDRVIHHS